MRAPRQDARLSPEVYLSIIVVIVAIVVMLAFKLSADFSTCASRGVHVRIRKPRLDRAHQSCESIFPIGVVGLNALRRRSCNVGRGPASRNCWTAGGS